MEEVWTGWVVLAVLAALTLGLAFRMWWRERRRSQEKDSFFKQAEDVFSFPEPTAAINEYETARETAFEELLSQGKVTQDEEDLPEGSPIEASWLRRVTADHKKKLKLFLLRRAHANVPRWFALSQEINGKYRLYRHGLLCEETWQSFVRAQETIQAELEYIRLEAEGLEPQWGERILKDAVTLYRLQQAKEAQQKEQELEAKKRAAQQKQDTLIQQQKEDALKRKAEKTAETLLKAEQAKQKGKKAAGR